MKKLLLEVSWYGLANYSEDDIRIALVQKFKSTNFSVKRIEEEEKKEAIVITMPDDLPATSTTTYDNIH